MKKNYLGILELKCTDSKMKKKSLDGFIKKFKMSEERVVKLEANQ